MKMIFARFMIVVISGLLVTTCSTNSDQKNCWEKTPALTFRPLLSPATILWHPGNGFTVEVGGEIQTPVGSFGVEQEIDLYRQGSCVMLIIQDNNLPLDQRYQIVNLDLSNSKVELQFNDDVMRDAVIEFEGSKFDIKKNNIEYLRVDVETIWINATDGHIKRLDITPLPSNACSLASDWFRESNKCLQDKDCGDFRYLQLGFREFSAGILLYFPRIFSCNKGEKVSHIIYWFSVAGLVTIFCTLFVAFVKKGRYVHALVVSVVLAWSVYIIIIS